MNLVFGGDNMITLKECRKKNNISIAKIAYILGISQQLYKRIEEYECDIDIKTAVKFAIATKTPIDEIIFFNPEI